MKKEVQQTTKAVTLRAAIERIKRKAELMMLEAPQAGHARQQAEELALLAGIALRCLEPVE